MLSVGALLEIERVPEADPAAWGSKLTVTVTDWLGASVVFEPPVTLNPVPVTKTVVMLTGAFPVFVTWSFCVAVSLSVTLPNDRLAGLAERVKIAATPVPLRGMLKGELPALLLIEMLPVATPVVVGWNETVKLMLAPAVTVTGAVNPDMP
jgi:hypothetical protein